MHLGVSGKDLTLSSHPVLPNILGVSPQCYYAVCSAGGVLGTHRQIYLLMEFPELGYRAGVGRKGLHPPERLAGHEAKRDLNPIPQPLKAGLSQPCPCFSLWHLVQSYTVIHTPPPHEKWPEPLHQACPMGGIEVRGEEAGFHPRDSEEPSLGEGKAATKGAGFILPR